MGASICISQFIFRVPTLIQNIHTTLIRNVNDDEHTIRVGSVRSRLAGRHGFGLHRVLLLG